MGFIYKQVDPLFEELGEAPDADALTYIGTNNITRLQQKAGICRLVKFLKDQSLWTNLAGGFLFGTSAGAISGTSLPDIKAGTSATLTGGSHLTNGILLTGANTDKISVGNRTFTDNYPPSTYVLAKNVGPNSTATNSIVFGFSCLSSANILRAFLFGKDTTGSATNLILRSDRGTNTTFTSIVANSSNLNRAIGICNSASDEKMYSSESSIGNENVLSTSGGNTRTYAANQQWLLHNLLNVGTASTEICVFHCLLFWDSNMSISRNNFLQIDSIARQIFV